MQVGLEVRLEDKTYSLSKESPHKDGNSTCVCVCGPGKSWGQNIPTKMWQYSNPLSL